MASSYWDLKGSESDEERRGERDCVIERQASRGRAAHKHGVVKETGSMLGGGDGAQRRSSIIGERSRDVKRC